MGFIRYILADARRLKWWHWLLIALPIIGQLHVSDAIVYQYRALSYSYQDFWYFLCLRLFCVLAFICIHKGGANGSIIMKGFVIIAAFKIVDEFTAPFDFRFPEVMAWILAVVRMKTIYNGTNK